MRLPRHLAIYRNRKTNPVANLPPGHSIARLRFHDGAGYWVGGYEIFDPDLRHSITGAKGKGTGYAPLTPKRKAKNGQRLIIREGQTGSPIPIPLDHLMAPAPGLIFFSFEEVFGKAGDLGRGGVVLSGLTYDPEDYEDLGFGLDQNGQVDSDDEN